MVWWFFKDEKITFQTKNWFLAGEGFNYHYKIRRNFFCQMNEINEQLKLLSLDFVRNFKSILQCFQLCILIYNHWDSRKRSFVAWKKQKVDSILAMPNFIHLQHNLSNLTNVYFVIGTVIAMNGYSWFTVKVKLGTLASNAGIL